MRIFILIAFLIPGVALSQEQTALDGMLDNMPDVKNFIQSVGIGLATITNETELRTKNDKTVLLFEPNIPTNTALSAQTKYIDLAFAFAGGRLRNEKEERSKYRDFRINFSKGSFDARLNYQFYKGAMVKAGGKEEFYSEYEVRSVNARANYYFNPVHLAYIREGYQLIDKVAGNKGFSTSGSWFVGFNIDQRSITLPEVLEPEHEAEVAAKDLDYIVHMQAVTFGPLVGGDGAMYFNRSFIRGKMGVGPAFFAAGDSAIQYEFAFNFGYVFGESHLVSFNADTYTLGLSSGNARLNNSNSQFGFFYTYKI
ncbi:MAG: hypothetical protein V4598_05355 [Bdellovibrionota bacterium]